MCRTATKSSPHSPQLEKARVSQHRPNAAKKKKIMWYMYTMEYYSRIKKNEIMPFAATWMDLEIIILSEVSKTKKDKYHMISLIYGI